MAKNFQEIMDFINSQGEELVISKQEALVIAEREEAYRQLSNDYYKLKRAMKTIMAAINEYKKEANT